MTARVSLLVADPRASPFATAGCGVAAEPVQSFAVASIGPGRTVSPAINAVRAEIVRVLGQHNLVLSDTQAPVRPAESALLADAPRAVYQVLLPKDPTHGYIVVYEFPDAAGRRGRRDAGAGLPRVRPGPSPDTAGHGDRHPSARNVGDPVFVVARRLHRRLPRRGSSRRWRRSASATRSRAERRPASAAAYTAGGMFVCDPRSSAARLALGVAIRAPGGCYGRCDPDSGRSTPCRTAARA